MTKRTNALWTPFAEVLCSTCHGSKEWNGQDVTVPETKSSEDDEHGYCTRCGNPVWVLGRSDVAILTRLRHKIGDGDLQQTGGMCAALAFTRADGGYVIATAEDTEHEITIGLYSKEGWEDSGECADVASYPVTPSLDKVRAGIRAMLDAVITKGEKK